GPPDRLAAEVERRIGQLGNLAEQAGWAELDAWTTRLAAMVAHRTGQHDLAERRLTDATQAYLAAGDLAGAGSCLLTRADWHAAPLSGAAVMDLAIQESGTGGSQLSPLHDSMEVTATAESISIADGFLAEAEALFTQANSPRGLAFVALHRSGHAFLRADDAAQLRHARAAAAGFTAAGDATHATLATAHLITARVALGAGDESQLLNRMAARLLAGGGFSHGLGLAYLLARIGRHWSIRRGDRQRALTAYETAGRFADALDATTAATQTIVDRATIWGAIGVRSARLLLLRQAVDRYLTQARRRTVTAPDCVRRARDAALGLLAAAPASRDTKEINDAIVFVTEVLRDTGAITGPRPGDDDDLLVLAQQDPEQFQDLLYRQAIEGGLLPARIAAALTAGSEQRAQGAAASRRGYEAALAEARTAEGPSALFWTAIVQVAWRRYHDAVGSYQRYLAAGGHTTGTSGALARPMTAFGDAGALTLASYRHGNDRDAATFFARARQFTLARAHLSAVHAIAGPDWWRRESDPWSARALEAEIAEGEGDFESALSAYTEALDRLEQEWHDLTTDEQRSARADNRAERSLYIAAARASLAAGRDPAAALTLIERSRAQALLDLVEGSRQLSQLPPTQADTVRRWRQASARAAALRRATAAEPTAGLRAELDRADETVARLARAVSPAHSHAAADARVLARRLPADTVLLTWAIVDDDLLIGAAHPNGDIHLEQFETDVDRLGGALRTFSQACRRGEPDGGAGALLAETLLAPLADHINAARQIVLVPWGEAHSAPLHALPFHGAPLLAGRPVCYLPSAGLLPEAADRHGAPTRSVVVGDPSRMSWRPPGRTAPRAYPPLRFARLEAAVVAALTAPTTALLGDDATAERMLPLLDGCRLLHLATHGIVVTQAPEMSAVLLADAATLSAADILGTGLTADLVVLSACDTGAGRRTDAGEVLGLGRALLGAGVRSAVVSLWPAADLPTCLQMTIMHARIRRGEPSTDALAAAARTVAALDPDAQLDLALDLEDWLTGNGDPAAIPLPLGSPPPLTWTSTSGKPAHWASFIHIGLPTTPRPAP
ncbi:MAG: CHAT domain-containing protein, partial [Frankia sp.]